MNPGIYHVTFHTSLGNGEGIVVFEDGKINGGDMGFTYAGTLEGSGQNLTAKLRVKKWSNNVSALVPSNDYTLELTGSEDGSGQFSVSGAPMGQRITIKGARIADAA